MNKTLTLALSVLALSAASFTAQAKTANIAKKPGKHHAKKTPAKPAEKPAADQPAQ